MEWEMNSISFLHPSTLKSWCVCSPNFKGFSWRATWYHRLPCFSFPAACSALQPTRGLRMQAGHLTPEVLVCSNIPSIPWLAFCELCVLCYFLIAQTSLFFLLSADSKRYEKIIKVLIHGRGIFSVIRLALLNRSSCLHLSGHSERCHHQT